jgi:hypothetical protein
MSLLILPEKRIYQPKSSLTITEAWRNRVIFHSSAFDNADVAVNTTGKTVIKGGVADNFTGSQYKKARKVWVDGDLTLMVGAITTFAAEYNYLIASHYDSFAYIEPITLRLNNGTIQLTTYGEVNRNVSLLAPASGSYNTFFAETTTSTQTVGYINVNRALAKTSDAFTMNSRAGYDLYVGAGANLSTPWRYYTAPILWSAIFRGRLTDAEKISLSQNPWQIFQPDIFLIPFGTITATLQYLAPISDLSTGGWSQSTGPTLYAVLDESVANDSDYISTTSATTCELKLGNGNDPLSSTGHILKYRILAGSGTLSVALKQGSTTIASWVHTLTGLPQDISNTLSGTEADSITDYTNLRVTFTSS